jgi:trimethylamine--corrinoid protein Co-methyltransferase
LVDVQIGHEKTITGLLPALAGANMIYGMGMLDMGMTLSYQQLMVDNEIARMILRAVSGIQVSSEHLAREVISRVGPGGHFLADEHTLKHYKQEAIEPLLFTRDNYDGWLNKGKPEIKEIATEEVKKILKTHEVEPLPNGVEKEFTKIIKSLEE